MDVDLAESLYHKHFVKGVILSFYLHKEPEVEKKHRLFNHGCHPITPSTTVYIKRQSKDTYMGKTDWRHWRCHLQI